MDELPPSLKQGVFLKTCRRGHSKEKEGRCRECRRIASIAYYWRDPQKCLDRHKAYRGRNPEKMKAQAKPRGSTANKRSHLKSKFGLSMERYQEMLDAQEGVCAICFKEETVIDGKTGRIRSLAVDHSHDTKIVRGLLCMGCNQGIGNMKEDFTTILRAARYIQSHQGVA